MKFDSRGRNPFLHLSLLAAELGLEFNSRTQPGGGCLREWRIRQESQDKYFRAPCDRQNSRSRQTIQWGRIVEGLEVQQKSMGSHKTSIDVAWGYPTFTSTSSPMGGAYRYRNAQPETSKTCLSPLVSHQLAKYTFALLMGYVLAGSARTEADRQFPKGNDRFFYPKLTREWKEGKKFSQPASVDPASCYNTRFDDGTSRLPRPNAKSSARLVRCTCVTIWLPRMAGCRVERDSPQARRPAPWQVKL